MEGAATTGAKGQPDTVYSYSVSFAVALSSRPISGIGRIWADGKLIRDADGVFKVPVTFRLHDGSEAQGLDPLIASIEGIGSTPAYRGLALAVFENLELVEFGNRIPFVTAEILGDEAPPTIGAILNDAAAGLIACTDARTVMGYAAYGPSIRAAIEPLVEGLAVSLVDRGSRLLTPSANVVAVELQRDLGASVDEPGPRYRREQIAVSQLPTAVRLSYYDPERDYQFGEAHAAVGEEGRIERQQGIPAVMEADSAKALAHAQLARTWAERARVTVRLPARYLSVEPGMILELPLSPSRWQIERSTLEGFACMLELRPCRQDVPLLVADPGRHLKRSVDAGQTVIALFEVPAAVGRSCEPTLLLAASSPGSRWQSANVEIKAGTHRFVERTASRKSLLGRALTMLRPDGTTVDVELIDPDQWLVSCDEEAMSQGGNMAMLGGEMIQFRDAEAIGPGRFRLGGLERALSGAERAAGSHGIGEFFVLLERDALRPIHLSGWVSPEALRMVKVQPIPRGPETAISTAPRLPGNPQKLI